MDPRRGRGSWRTSPSTWPPVSGWRVLGPSGSGKSRALLRGRRGAPAADDRPGAPRRPQRDERAPVPARGRARVPGRRALPPPGRRRQRRVRSEGRGAPTTTCVCSRVFRGTGAGRPRRSRGPGRHDALGRRGATHRTRTGARDASGSPSARRAARLAGRAAPAPPAGRPPRPVRAAVGSRSCTSRTTSARRSRSATAWRSCARGRLAQVATPEALWARPADDWVARFLGLPEHRAGTETTRP